MPINVGFATVQLPLPTSTRLAGYAVENRLATGAAEPLTATTARFESPGHNAPRTLVWISIDALAISTPLHDAVQLAVASRLPDVAVLVSATHTHSAPGAWCGTIHPLLPSALDTAQIELVARRIGDALPTVTPADLAWGATSVDGVGSNRDDPSLPVDTSLGVLAALADGRPIGLIVDHACHPTVLGPDNTLCSPDWVGGLRAGIAEAIPNTPVLFLQGAAGDVSTRFTRRASSLDEAERIGRLVTDAALESLDSAQPVDAASGIHVHRHALTLHRRDAAAELSVRDAPAEPAGLDGLRALAANLGPATLEVPITDVRIGAERYLTTPFELQNSWGRRLAQTGNLRFVGYTDAYRGYLAGPRSHTHGTYEATSSFADAAESERLMSQMMRIAST